MLTWVEINEGAVEHNLKQFRQRVGSRVKIMAVVKSNAYGHGQIPLAKVALRSGADWLGVINLEEALTVRRAGITAPLFILSFWDRDLANKELFSLGRSPTGETLGRRPTGETYG